MNKLHISKTKLKSKRVETGLTQAELANYAEINLGSLKNLEQGNSNIDAVKLITLLNICNCLNCKLEDILEDEETIIALKKYYNRIYYVK